MEANKTILVGQPFHGAPPPPTIAFPFPSSLATGKQIGPRIYHENTITFGLMWFAEIKRYNEALF